MLADQAFDVGTTSQLRVRTFNGLYSSRTKTCSKLANIGNICALEPIWDYTATKMATDHCVTKRVVLKRPRDGRESVVNCVVFGTRYTFCEMLQNEEAFGSGKRQVVRRYPVIGAGDHECVAFVSVSVRQEIIEAAKVVRIEVVKR